MDNERLESMKILLKNLTGKISQINLFNGWHLNVFNEQFPGILDSVQFLKIECGDDDILLNWLMTNIGKQKVMHICSDYSGSTFIENVKKVRK